MALNVKRTVFYVVKRTVFDIPSKPKRTVFYGGQIA